MSLLQSDESRFPFGRGVKEVFLIAVIASGCGTGSDPGVGAGTGAASNKAEASHAKSEAATALEAKQIRVVFDEQGQVYRVGRESDPANLGYDEEILKKLAEQEVHIRELCLESAASARSQDGHGISDETMSIVSGMKGLWHLNLDYTDIGDAGIALLDLPELVSLHLAGTKVTDGGLEDIVKRFPKISDLVLNDTAITDDGMKQLNRLTGLMRLDIHRTNISKKGVLELKGLTKLIDIGAIATKVTAADEKAVKEALPDTQLSITSGKK